MKKGLLASVVVLALFVGYVAAGPYLTIAAIKTGVAEQDSEKLSENINFPILRQNMKDQINAAMLKNINTEEESNPFAVLAMGVASKLADGIVDAYVTPSGLAATMKGKSPNNNDDDLPEAEETSNKEELFKDAKFSYDSLSKFSIWSKNNKGEEVRFVLQREGICWKLVNIVIPIDETP